jgi:hypothetical protein
MTRENGTRSGTRPALPPEASEAEDPPPALDRAVQSRIGDHLRSMYDDLTRQPVPDRFRDLLARLDERERDPGS